MSVDQAPATLEQPPSPSDEEVGGRFEWIATRERIGDALDALQEKLLLMPPGPPGEQDSALLVSLALSLDTQISRAEAKEENRFSPDVLAWRSRLDACVADLAKRGVLLAPAPPPAPLPAPAPVGVAAPAQARPFGWLVPRRGVRVSPLVRVGRVLTVGALAVLLFMMYEFGFSSLDHGRTQSALLAEFRNDLATGAAPGPNSLPRLGQPVALLIIPRIGVQQVVVEGTAPEALKGGPGHLRSSPLPGQVGNAVIAARRTSYGRPFRQLDRLEEGDLIEAVTAEGAFRYKVSEVRAVSPGQADVLGFSQDNRLTLVTSNPPYSAKGRLAVLATLEGDGYSSPVYLHPVTLSKAEKGLAPDTGGVAALVVWGELLVLALIGTVLLYRRWRTRPAYLLTTPVLLLLVLLVFSSVDRLLPSTL